MKNSLRILIPLLGLAAALPLARAEDAAQPTPKEEKKGLRVITGPDHRAVIRHIGAAMEMEPVTYLGVETSPVGATLTAQLGLQDGAGLVVNQVVPDSPAAAVLKPHDILLKLDDQLLVEQRQLAVLVRNHKEGDEVTLTFLRGGKQTTAKVKLAKHDAPKQFGMEWTPGMPGFGGMTGNAFPFGPGVGNATFETFGPGGGQIANPEEIDRLLGLIDRGFVPGQQRMNIMHSGSPGDRSINVTVNTGNSHVVLDDEKGSLDLTIKEGRKELVAKNTKGEQVFAGPIDTPEERKALPEDVRSRLDKLEDSTQFSFKTDRDFKGAETKVLRPRGQGIAVPLPPVMPGSHAPLFF
jgi:hypothetical protein